MTELDDAIEQLLARYIPDAHQRIQVRNGICALITAAGGDVATQVPQPDELLGRIDTTLTDYDATQFPPLPKFAATMRVPREMVETNPVDIMAQLNAEHAAQVDRATAPPCCDLHNQHCEVPFNLCCDTCPEVVALAEFVATWQKTQEGIGAIDIARQLAGMPPLPDQIDEDQALIKASPTRLSRLVTWLRRRAQP